MAPRFAMSALVRSTSGCSVRQSTPRLPTAPDGTKPSEPSRRPGQEGPARLNPASDRSIAVWVTVATCARRSRSTCAARRWPYRCRCGCTSSRSRSTCRVTGPTTWMSICSDTLPTGRSPSPSATTSAEPSGVTRDGEQRRVPVDPGRRRRVGEAEPHRRGVGPLVAPTRPGSAPVAICHSVLSRNPSGKSTSAAIDEVLRRRRTGSGTSPQLVGPRQRRSGRARQVGVGEHAGDDDAHLVVGRGGVAQHALDL